MKFISWNVAGYRACLKKGFAEFFESIDADFFSLQEVKALEGQINYKPEGYFCYRNIAEKKGYSGTIIYAKKKANDVFYGMDIAEHDNEGRLITLEYDDFFLINTYVPNVKRDLSRLEYRMKWEDDFREYVNSLKKKKMVIICGDFNVAHEEIDIKNAKANIGNAGFTYEERGKFNELLNSGFTDTFRHFYPEKEGCYSWWSYMFHARENNVGWRIDYFFVSNSLKPRLKSAEIYEDVMSSDHCPVSIDLDL
jgi:exodeoxyribonuclease-3